MQEYTSNSKEETQKIASNFAKSLKGGEVLCFYGNLGTGKTTFIQSLAKALGVKENVTSPTYVLIKKYKTANKKSIPSKKVVAKNIQYPISNIQFFYHMDAYRLGSSQEALDLGLEEIWNDPANIIAIEWADKISDILPKNKIDLCFVYPEPSRGKHIEGDKRKITIFN